MMIILSPSKTMHPKPVMTSTPQTVPIFTSEASILSNYIHQNPLQAASLHASDTIAKRTAGLYKQRALAKSHEPTPTQAAWLYRGETFFGLAAETFNAAQIDFANTHLRILSGLYGSVRITDMIQEYRLEMQAKLTGPWGTTIYDFWGDAIANEIFTHKPAWILNAASNEYFRAIKPYVPADLPVITPRFITATSTNTRQQNTFPKYCRGLLARWMIKHAITDRDRISSFDEEGFTFDKSLSTPNQPVFRAQKDFTIKGRFVKK